MLLTLWQVETGVKAHLVTFSQIVRGMVNNASQKLSDPFISMPKIVLRMVRPVPLQTAQPRRETEPVADGLGFASPLSDRTHSKPSPSHSSARVARSPKNESGGPSSSARRIPLVFASTDQLPHRLAVGAQLDGPAVG